MRGSCASTHAPDCRTAATPDRDALRRLRGGPPRTFHGSAFKLLAAAYVAASKLACKIGDGGAALLTADRASTAARLAEEPGSDRNRLWTAFGPTNIVIHSVSAAVRAGNPDRALEIGVRLDTSRLPTALVGRRAQVHLDLAAATAMGTDGSSVAVLHLLEAERVAPEAIRANVQARSLLLDLLTKERRTATPGLRPMAVRAGLLA